MTSARGPPPPPLKGAAPCWGPAATPRGAAPRSPGCPVPGVSRSSPRHEHAPRWCFRKETLLVAPLAGTQPRVGGGARPGSRRPGPALPSVPAAPAPSLRGEKFPRGNRSREVPGVGVPAVRGAEPGSAPPGAPGPPVSRGWWRRRRDRGARTGWMHQAIRRKINLRGKACLYIRYASGSSSPPRGEPGEGRAWPGAPSPWCPRGAGGGEAAGRKARGVAEARAVQEPWGGRG